MAFPHWLRRAKNQKRRTRDQVLFRPASFVLRRKMVRLLRQRPLQLITAIVMALAAGAIAVTSAAGLALVEPHDRAYPVSLLSALEADYTRWPDSGPSQRRLDVAIIADAARDEIARNAVPAANTSALVPLDYQQHEGIAGAAGRDGGNPANGHE